MLSLFSFRIWIWMLNTSWASSRFLFLVCKLPVVHQESGHWGWMAVPCYRITPDFPWTTSHIFSSQWQQTENTKCVTWRAFLAPCTRSPLTPWRATLLLTCWPALIFSAGLELTCPKKWLLYVSSNKTLNDAAKAIFTGISLNALLTSVMMMSSRFLLPQLNYL